MTNQRIAKFIAGSGICLRRQAEKLIADGLVKVNNKLIDSPAIKVSDEDIVEVNGKVIKQTEPKLWLYHKPCGLITTHSDPQNRPTVFASLKGKLPGVISVGRLDLNSEGLLLLTNNGELARKMTLPSNGYRRIYKVRAYGSPDKLKIQNNQVVIDGVIYKIQSVKVTKKGQRNSWYEIVLTEGKNREIRKIFEHFGLRVNRLIRIAYGNYKLGNLKSGQYREVKMDKIS